MRFFKYHKRVVIFTLLLILIISPLTFRKVYENRFAIVQNESIFHFIPLYRSLRKLSDIFTVPLYIFSDSKLDTVNLSISPKNIRRMNEALPDKPLGHAKLDSANRVWVKADFSAEGYSDRVDIRYRGNTNGHWNSYKKSYLIKFPKDNLYKGMRELTMIIPKDRRYFTTAINNYRARKLGFVVPDDEYVRLNLNGADHGVYIAFERWSQEWMEKMGIEPTSILVGGDGDTTLADFSFYSLNGIQYWKSWNYDEELPYEFSKPLAELVEHADNKTFEKIIPQLIDLDLFLAQDTLSVLSGGYHSSGLHVALSNIVLYFDAIEGKLKPIPYNVSLVEHIAGTGTTGDPTVLQQRLWEIPSFMDRRTEIFTTYVSEEKADDLQFLNNWRKRMDVEFYRDVAKLDSNLMYRHKINYYEDVVEEYFDDPYNIIGGEEKYKPLVVEERPLSFEDSYTYLTDAVMTPEEFLQKHPQFFLQSENIILPSGPHFFSRDIIVPVNTKLTISPGATLLMGEGVSLVSYSPVEAQGTAYQPIRIIAANKDKPWGVLAVINTESESSSFRHLYISNGKDDTINGVYFSGMLAMHNADGEILNSRIENANADDGVNIKKGEVLVQGNVFSNNSSDGIDVDFARGSTALIDNQFFDNDGDAIDLSWSELLIDGNVIIGCLDKGISVGERSKPIVSKNLVAQCAIGIASKDSSLVTADNNIFIGNRVAASAYQKKPIYEGGEALISGGTFWGNARNIRVDDLSVIELDGVSETEPDLSLFPRFIQEKILQ